MDVHDYVRLPYHIGMMRSETVDGNVGWVSWVEELEGCISQGETPAEAASMIYEAMELWIETALESGEAVPFPRPEPAHSGRFQVRLPSSLHTALVRAAEREGVSLNQYVSNSLAAASGWWEVDEGIPARVS
ncbi:MAG: type II toxin-antitoxin system HicB family antitoxin [Chloroflexi bacterium]|nr:type II toxin-antitoxin system HicB family antitoxin [Chloroflexota bacterium]